MPDPQVPVTQPESGAAQVPPQTRAIAVGPGTSGSTQAASAPTAAGWLGPALTTPIEQLPKGQAYLSLMMDEAQGRQGFWEALSPDRRDLPGVGDIAAGIDLVKVPYTLHKLKTGQQVDDADLLELNYFIKRSQREANRTLGGSVAAGLKGLVQFGTEFAATTLILGLGLAGGPVGEGAALGSVLAAASKKAAVKTAEAAAKKAIFEATENVAEKAAAKLVWEAAEKEAKDLAAEIAAKKVGKSVTAVAREASAEQAAKIAETGAGKTLQTMSGAQAAFRSAQKGVATAAEKIVVDAMGEKAGAKVLGKLAYGTTFAGLPALGMLAVDQAVDVVGAGVTGNAPVTLGMVNREVEQVLNGQAVDPVAAKMFDLGDKYVEYFSEFTGGLMASGARGVAGALSKAAPGATSVAEAAGARMAASIRNYFGGEALQSAEAISKVAAKRVADKQWFAAAGAYLGAFAVKHQVNLDTAAGMIQAAGYDGYLEEMAEERLGGFIKGLTGIQGGEAGLSNAFDQMMPPIKDLAVEAIVFALPMVSASGLHVVQNTKWAGGQGLNGLYKDFAEARRLMTVQKDAFETAEARQEATDKLATIVQASAALNSRDRSGFHKIIDLVTAATRFDAAGMQYKGLDEVLLNHELPAIVDAWRATYDAAKASKTAGRDTTHEEATAAARAVLDKTLEYQRQTVALEGIPEQQGPAPAEDPSALAPIPAAELAADANALVATPGSGLATEQIGGRRTVVRSTQTDAGEVIRMDEAIDEALRKAGVDPSSRSVAQYHANALSATVDKSRFLAALDPSAKPEVKAGLMWDLGLNPREKASWDAFSDVVAPWISRAIDAAEKRGVDIRIARRTGDVVDTMPNLLTLFKGYSQRELEQFGAVEKDAKSKPVLEGGLPKYRITPGAKNMVVDGRPTVIWGMQESLSRNAANGQRRSGLYHLFEDPLEAGNAQNAIEAVADAAQTHIKAELARKDLGPQTRKAFAYLDELLTDPAKRVETAGKIVSKEFRWREDTGNGELTLPLSAEINLLPKLDDLLKTDAGKLAGVKAEVAAALGSSSWEEALSIWTNPWTGVKGKAVGPTTPGVSGPVKTGTPPGGSTPSGDKGPVGKAPDALDYNELGGKRAADLAAWVRSNMEAGAAVGVRFPGITDSLGRVVTKDAGGILLEDGFETPDGRVLEDDNNRGLLPVFRENAQGEKFWSLRPAIDIIRDTPFLRAKLKNVPANAVADQVTPAQESVYGPGVRFANVEATRAEILNEALKQTDPVKLRAELEMHRRRFEQYSTKGVRGQPMSDRLRAAMTEEGRAISARIAELEGQPQEPAAQEEVLDPLLGQDVPQGKPFGEVIPNGQEEKGREEALLIPPAENASAPEQSGADVSPADDTPDLPSSAPIGRIFKSFGDANSLANANEIRREVEEKLNLRGPPEKVKGWLELLAAVQHKELTPEATAAVEEVRQVAAVVDPNRARLGDLYAAIERAEKLANSDLVRPAAKKEEEPIETHDTEGRADDSINNHLAQSRFLTDVLRALKAPPITHGQVVRYFNETTILRSAWQAGEANAAAVLRGEADHQDGAPTIAAVLRRIAEQLESKQFDTGYLVSLDSMFRGQILPHLSVHTNEKGQVEVRAHEGNVLAQLAEQISAATIRNLPDRATANNWLQELEAAAGVAAEAAVLTRLYDLPVVAGDAVSPLLRAVTEYSTGKSDFDQMIIGLAVDTKRALMDWKDDSQPAITRANMVLRLAWFNKAQVYDVASRLPATSKFGAEWVRAGRLQQISNNADAGILPEGAARNFVQQILETPLQILDARGKRVSTFYQPSSAQRALQGLGYKVAILASGSEFLDRRVGKDEKSVVQERETYAADDLPRKLLEAGLNELYEASVREEAADAKAKKLKDSYKYWAWVSNMGENSRIMLYQRERISDVFTLQAKHGANYEAWHKLLKEHTAKEPEMLDRIMLPFDELVKMGQAGDWRTVNHALAIFEAQTAIMGAPSNYKAKEFLADFRKRQSVRMTPAFRFIEGVPGGLPGTLQVAVFEDPVDTIPIVGTDGTKQVVSTDGVMFFFGDTSARAAKSIGPMVIRGEKDITATKTLHSGVPDSPAGVAQIGKESAFNVDEMAAAFPGSVWEALQKKWLGADPATRPHMGRFASAVKHKGAKVNAAPVHDEFGWTIASMDSEPWSLADFGLIFDPRHSTEPENRKVPVQFMPSLYALTNPDTLSIMRALRDDYERRTDALLTAFKAGRLEQIVKVLKTVESAAEDPVVQGIIKGERSISPTDQLHVAGFLHSHFLKQIAFTGPMVQNVLAPHGLPDNGLRHSYRVRITDAGVEEIPDSEPLNDAATDVRAVAAEARANVDGARMTGVVNFNSYEAWLKKDEGQRRQWERPGDGPAARQLQATREDAIRAAAILVLRDARLSDLRRFDDPAANGGKVIQMADAQAVLQRLLAGEKVSFTELAKHVRVQDLARVEQTPAGFYSVVRGETFFWMRVPSPGMSTVGVARLEGPIAGGKNQIAKAALSIQIAGEDFDVDKEFLVMLPRNKKTGNFELKGGRQNLTGLYLYLSQQLGEDMRSFRLSNQFTDADAYRTHKVDGVEITGMADAYRMKAAKAAPLFTLEGGLQSRDLMSDGGESLERTAAWTRLFNTFVAAKLYMRNETGAIHSGVGKLTVSGEFYDFKTGKLLPGTREIKMGWPDGFWDNLPLAALMDHYNTILNMATDYGKQDGALRYLAGPQDLPIANMLMAMNPDLSKPGTTRDQVREYFATVIGYLHSPEWADPKSAFSNSMRTLNSKFLELQRFVNAADKRVTSFGELMDLKAEYEAAKTQGIVLAAGAKPGDKPRRYFDTRGAFFDVSVVDGKEVVKPGPLIARHEAYFRAAEDAYYGTPSWTKTGRKLWSGVEEGLKGRGLTFKQRQAIQLRFDGRLASALAVMSLSRFFPGKTLQELHAAALRGINLLPLDNAFRIYFEATTDREQYFDPATGATYANARPQLLTALTQTASITPDNITRAQAAFAALPQTLGETQGLALQRLMMLITATQNAPMPGALLAGNWWDMVDNKTIEAHNATMEQLEVPEDAAPAAGKDAGRLAPTAFWAQLMRWQNEELTAEEMKVLQSWVVAPLRNGQGIKSVFVLPPKAAEEMKPVTIPAPVVEVPKTAPAPAVPSAPAPPVQTPADATPATGNILFSRRNNISKWMSNFETGGQQLQITDELGISYPTVEHAFQAAKTLDPARRREIAAAATPNEARTMGRDKAKTVLRKDWTDNDKVRIMLGFVQQKFQNPVLRQMLLATGDRALFENTTGWSDDFWGIHQTTSGWKGKNYLGRILEKVRVDAGGLARAIAPVTPAAAPVTPATQTPSTPGQPAPEYATSEAQVKAWVQAAAPVKMSNQRMDFSLKEAADADHSSARYWTQEQVDTAVKIRKWFLDRSGPAEALLEGPAGSGKTTLLNKILRDLMTENRSLANGIVLGAIAHRAKSVAIRLTQFTDRYGDLSRHRAGVVDQLVYEINDPRTGKPTLKGQLLNPQYGTPKFVIIDEASMVPADALRKLRTAAQTLGFKLLFVGDRHQIPPVESELRDGRKILPVWDYFAGHASEHFRLTQVMRQAQGNPIAVEISRIRDGLESGQMFNTSEQLPAQTLVSRNAEGLVTGTIVAPGVAGRQVINDFVKRVFAQGGNDLLVKDPNLLRVITWTNARVAEYNREIRQLIKPQATQPWEPGDLLMGYAQRGGPEADFQLMNGADYLVIATGAPRKKTLTSFGGTTHDIMVMPVTLQETEIPLGSEKAPTHKVEIAMPDQQAQYEAWLGPYIRELTRLKQVALGNRSAWSDFYDFQRDIQDATAHVINPFALSAALQSNDARGLTDKAIDYGYALTLHKVQGGSIKYVAVDVLDILGNQSGEAGNLLYTAVTRAVHAALIASPTNAGALPSAVLMDDLVGSVVQAAQAKPTTPAAKQAAPRKPGISNIQKISEYESHADWVRPSGEVVRIRYNTNKKGEVTYVSPIKGSALSEDDQLDLEQALQDRPASDIESGAADQDVQFSLAQTAQNIAFRKGYREAAGKEYVTGSDPSPELRAKASSLAKLARARWKHVIDRIESAPSAGAAMARLRSLEQETRQASPYLRWTAEDTQRLKEQVLLPHFGAAFVDRRVEETSDEKAFREEILGIEAAQPDTGGSRISFLPGLGDARELAFSLADAQEWMDAVATKLAPTGEAALHQILMKEMRELGFIRDRETHRFNQAVKYYGTWLRYHDTINPLLPDGSYDKKKKVEWTKEDFETMRQYQGLLNALMEHFPSGMTKAQFDAWLADPRRLAKRKVTFTDNRTPEELQIDGVPWGYVIAEGIPAVESFPAAIARIMGSNAIAKLKANGRSFDLYQELKDAREFYDDAQARLPWLIKKRANYVQHVFGSGFQGFDMRAANDALLRALDQLPKTSAASATLLSDEAAYERDFSQGVPPALQVQRDLFKKLAPKATVPKDDQGNETWTRADYNSAILHLLREQEITKALAAVRGNTEYIGDPATLATIKALQRALYATKYKEWTGRSMERTVEGTFAQIFHEHGLKPGALDLNEARFRYTNDVFAAAFNKSILNQMLLQSDTNGAPLIVAIPSDVFDQENVIRPEVLKEHARRVLGYYGYKLDPARSPKEQLAWAANHLLGAGNFEKIGSKFPSISHFLAAKGGPADILKHVVDEPFKWMVGDVDALEQLVRITQWSKITSVGWSVFFPISLMESVVAGTGLAKNVLWNLPEFTKQMKAIRADLVRHGNSPYRDLQSLMVRAGIQLSEVAASDAPMGIADKDVAALVDWVRRNHGEKAAEYVRHALRTWQGRWLSEKFFGDYFPAMKLWAANRLMEETAKNAGIDTSTEEGKLSVLKLIAPTINDAYGGQFWTRYTWATPKVLQILNLTMFAPNWSISAWNIAGGGLISGKFLGNTMTDTNKDFVFKTNWPAMLALVMIGLPSALQAAIWALSKAGDGDPDDKLLMLNNEPGRELSIDITPVVRLMPGYKGEPTGKRRFYMRFGKQAQEVVGAGGWLQTPIEQLLRKLSQPARAVIEQLTGRSPGSDFDLEFKGQGMLGWIKSSKPGFEGLQTSRVGYLVSKFVPMSVLTIAKTPEAAVAAFVAPVSKGMSMGKATDALIQVLNTYADEETYNKVSALASSKSNLDALAPAILEAVRRNGYDPTKVLSGARGAVLGRLYGDFWNALNAGDTKKMDKIAIPILRLHGTIEGLSQSMKNREKQFQRPLSDEQKQQVVDLFAQFERPI